MAHGIGNPFFIGLLSFSLFYSLSVTGFLESVLNRREKLLEASPFLSFPQVPFSVYMEAFQF